MPCVRTVPNSLRRKAGSYGALSHISTWNQGTPTPLYPKGRETASVWNGGRRRRSSQMPGCNGQDTVKVRQGKRYKMHANGRGKECRWRQVLLLVRLAVSNDQSARAESYRPTGKRSAGKLACSVWSGGKVVRPYLSLLESWFLLDGVPDLPRRRSSAPSRWAGARKLIANFRPAMICCSYNPTA
jgi:hypothetical protein